MFSISKLGFILLLAYAVVCLVVSVWSFIIVLRQRKALKYYDDLFKQLGFNIEKATWDLDKFQDFSVRLYTKAVKETRPGTVTKGKDG